MNIYVANLWNRLKTNFWLLPSLLIVIAFIFSFFTLHLDNSYKVKDFYAYSVWIGGADGARGLLSTIAGSVITITGVVFSITTVSLALASNQYGSKLLPNFIRDVGTQVVLGTFLATSIYTLLILRTVKGNGLDENVDTFVPNFSITISLGLAIVSLCMLIYFIHRISVKIQSNDIIARVTQDLFHTIDNSMSNGPTQNQVQNSQKKENCQFEILSPKIGYLQIIDYKKILKIAKKYQLMIEIDKRAGHFIRQGTILVKVNSNPSKYVEKLIIKSFVIDKERSPVQDIEYAIDQLVTIAVRALSSNANDVFTTNSCLDYLGAALGMICQKNLNPLEYEQNPYIMLTSNQETFEGLVDASFHQIRQYGKDHPSVLIHILETLTSILTCTKNQEQRIALQKHANMIKNLENTFLEEQDCLDIKRRYESFLIELKQISDKKDLDLSDKT